MKSLVHAAACSSIRSGRLFPAEQARIAQLLVERVEIGEDGLEIRFRTDGLVREFGVDARAAA